MLLTLVDKDSFDYSEANHDVILEKQSSCVPLIGDLIKDGHGLSAFNVYRVEGRVFRSKPVRNGEDTDFSSVYLLVSTVSQN
ncbi:hypothetical protein CLV78_104179 [Aliiruegeria haliotis]|uniref:Uncharacterized protein n=1 Tax=Aliiruegeria haliotis TaxID=1280846 RepID=A0A2T0RR92_9RHOB|nr:hypothetical protein [Aliiruegeria haliotis]PRY23688.1 hypothetical protein CLV78_104179 [Aliiruegeria haliotis]